MWNMTVVMQTSSQLYEFVGPYLYLNGEDLLDMSFA